MIHKRGRGGVRMLVYTLIGAIVGVLLGHIIPPGYFFWFVVGAVSGYFLQRYTSHKY